MSWSPEDDIEEVREEVEAETAQPRQTNWGRMLPEGCCTWCGHADHEPGCAATVMVGKEQQHCPCARP